MRRPLFPFAPTEKLTRNIGISLGFYAAVFGKVLGRRSEPPKNLVRCSIYQQRNDIKTHRTGAKQALFSACAAVFGLCNCIF